MALSLFQNVFRKNSPNNSSATQNKKQIINDGKINILLLGETGVGKSTFINSFVNYISFRNFDVAMKNEPIYVLPAMITFYTDDMVEKQVPIGSDKNEYTDVGVSATQGTKSYVFPIDNNIELRIIDTPGIGDTRGFEQDKENLENILDFLGRFQTLHAICILLKPNNSRLTVMFEFCLKQLLSKLEKSAAENMIFVFTNSRSSFYRPGETKKVLEKLLSNIKNNPPHITIPFNLENTFCMDNEAFKFLIACKNDIKFSKQETHVFTASWNKSVEECVRMIKYIVGVDNKSGLKPHQIQNTISINEARRVIYMLSKPLSDITQLIQDNREIIINHMKKVTINKNENKNLENQLYVPCVKLKTIELKQPVTVCTSETCVQIITVENNKMTEYTQRCHDPCYLQNVPKEIIGTKELVYCAAMNRTNNCKQCKCGFQVHMHIYYMTKRYEDRVEDKSIKQQLSKLTTDREKYETYTKIVESKIKELDGEHHIITKSLAKFAHFLKINTILPFNDSYKAYIEYLIDREERLGPNGNKKLIKYYQDMLKQYEEEKYILENAMNTSGAGDAVHNVTANDIHDSIQKLFTLKHNGPKLKSLYEQQSKGMTKEHNHNEEYCHRLLTDSTSFLAYQTQSNTQGNARGNRQQSDEDGMVEIKMPKYFIDKIVTQIPKVNAMKGVKVVRKDDVLKITGNDNNAVKNAVLLLTIRECIFNVPKSCVFKFLEDNGKIIDGIVEESDLIQIKAIGENDQTFKGSRRPGVVPFLLIGNSDAVNKAKRDFLGKVKMWEHIDAQPFNLKKTFVYNGGKKKSKKTEVRKPNEEFKVPKHLLPLVYGENGVNVANAYKIDGVEKINIDKKLATVKIYGKTKACTIKARSLLEIKEGIIDVPKEFEKHKELLEPMKDICKLYDFKIGQPSKKSIPITCIGFSEQINKAKRILQTHLEAVGLKYQLGIRYVGINTQTLNAEKLLVEVFSVDQHLLEISNCNLQRAKDIDGIVDVEENFGVFTIKARSSRALKEARALLENKEETYELPRQFVYKLLEKDGQMLKDIMATSNVSTIKVIGDDVEDPLSSIRQLKIIGSLEAITQTKKIISFFEKSYIGPQDAVGNFKIPDRTFNRNQEAINVKSTPPQYFKEQFTVQKHLLSFAIGTIGQNLDRAKNISGIVSVTNDDGKFTIEATSLEAIEEAKNMLEIVDEILLVKEKTIKKVTESSLAHLKSIGILNVRILSSKSSAENIMYQIMQSYIGDISLDVFDTQDQSAVVSLPRALVIKLLEENAMILKVLVDVSGVDEIKIVGDDESRAPKLDMIIKGSYTAISKVKQILENITKTLPTQSLTDANLTHVKSFNLKSNKVPAGMVKVQLVGTKCSIPNAVAYITELGHYVQEITVSEKLLPLSLGKGSVNLIKASNVEGIVKIEKKANTFEIRGTTEESVLEASNFLEITETTFIILPQFIMHYTMDSGRTLNKLTQLHNCISVHKDSSGTFPNFTFKISIIGSKANVPQAVESLNAYFQTIERQSNVPNSPSVTSMGSTGESEQISGAKSTKNVYVEDLLQLSDFPQRDAKKIVDKSSEEMIDFFSSINSNQDSAGCNDGNDLLSKKTQSFNTPLDFFNVSAAQGESSSLQLENVGGAVGYSTPNTDSLSMKSLLDDLLKISPPSDIGRAHLENSPSEKFDLDFIKTARDERSSSKREAHDNLSNVETSKQLSVSDLIKLFQSNQIPDNVENSLKNEPSEQLRYKMSSRESSPKDENEEANTECPTM